MFRTPRSRLRWARSLIPLMTFIGVVAAIGGDWLTTVGMVLLIAAQVIVYRRARGELGEGDGVPEPEIKEK